MLGNSWPRAICGAGGGAWLTTPTTGRSTQRPAAGFSDRAARGSVFLRKMACLPAAGFIVEGSRPSARARGAAYGFPLRALPGWQAGVMIVAVYLPDFRTISYGHPGHP